MSSRGFKTRDCERRTADDATILAWAAANDFILLTHDSHTIPAHVRDFVLAGRPIRGAFIIERRAPIRELVELLVLYAACSLPNEWENRITYL